MSFEEDLISSFMKYYRIKTPLTKKIRDELKCISNRLGGCGSADYFNHRIYLYMIETDDDCDNHREYAIADIALYDDDEIDDAIIKPTDDSIKPPDVIENYTANDEYTEADTSEIDE